MWCVCNEGCAVCGGCILRDARCMVVVYLGMHSVWWDLLNAVRDVLNPVKDVLNAVRDLLNAVMDVLKRSEGCA